MAEKTSGTKLSTLFFTFLKIGAFTFGGGYAMLALLEREFLDRRSWLTKDEFLDMTAIAESTPGPMAIDSASLYRLPSGRHSRGRTGHPGGMHPLLCHHLSDLPVF